MIMWYFKPGEREAFINGMKGALECLKVIEAVLSVHRNRHDCIASDYIEFARKNIFSGTKMIEILLNSIPEGNIDTVEPSKEAMRGLRPNAVTHDEYDVP